MRTHTWLGKQIGQGLTIAIGMEIGVVWLRPATDRPFLFETTEVSLDTVVYVVGVKLDQIDYNELIT